MPHLISTGMNCTPCVLQSDWSVGKYCLVSSSLSASIPRNGEEKNTRHTRASLSFLFPLLATDPSCSLSLSESLSSPFELSDSFFIPLPPFFLSSPPLLILYFLANCFFFYSVKWLDLHHENMSIFWDTQFPLSLFSRYINTEFQKQKT